MPLETLDRLFRGDRWILDAWQLAVELWDELLARYDLREDGDLSQLARIFGDNQFRFEYRCGYHQPGREIMAWCFFTRLYDPGDGFGPNEDLALAGRQAFLKSECYSDVKFAAAKAAEAYRLED